MAVRPEDMIVLWILIAAILAIILWMLIAPFKLCVNTYKNQYYVSFGGIIKASLCLRQDMPCLNLRIPFYSYYTDPFAAKDSKKVTKVKSKAAGKKKSSGWQKLDLSTVLAMIRTFTVKHFYVDVDTDNYVLNAQLIPIFVGLSQGKAQWQVNFQGQANLWVVVENRLYQLIRPIIKYSIKQHF